MAPAITLLTNANIYTLDPARPRAAAMAIQDGRVIATGSQHALEAEFPDVKKINLAGQTILPGLTDAHMHLQHYALGLKMVDCETPTRSACLQRVAERARQTPPGQWILGHGWNQNSWADDKNEGFGSAGELDEAAPNNPVYLTAKSLHAGWANNLALQMAGLHAGTPDPQDGRLGRLADGRPNGILFETAMDLVSSVVPAADHETISQAIQDALPHLWKLGITGVHDFDRRSCFMALQTLHERGQLLLRVVKSIPLENLPEALALGLRSGFGNDFLRIGSVKAFADGALGPHTAAMLQPYEDDPSNRGILMLDSEHLLEHARQAMEGGLSMAVHAIGDSAVHEVLNALEQVILLERSKQVRSKNYLRHRIEHVQVIHPDDSGRLGKLGIIASMQPIHATSDMLMADRYWGKRTAFSYALRTQMEHGAVLALGSDAPVESPNPFWGLHAAVTRQRVDGTPGEEGWHPEQRLTLEEAMAGFTKGAAYAAGMEDRLGQLTPGYYADLITLEQDPYHIPARDLAHLAPTAVMVNGTWVLGEPAS